MAKKATKAESASGGVPDVGGVYRPEIVTYVIIGTSALLQNNPAAFIGKTEADTLASKKTYVDAEEAAMRCYRDGERYCHPSQAFLKAAVRAVSGKKFGKTSAPGLLKGSVFVTEDFSTLENSDGAPLAEFTINRLPVVVNKARVLRCRPQWSPWRLKLALEINVALIQPSQVKDSLALAGVTVGVGDYRPEKSGRFGRFRIE